MYITEFKVSRNKGQWASERILGPTKIWNVEPLKYFHFSWVWDVSYYESGIDNY